MLLIFVQTECISVIFLQDTAVEGPIYYGR